jgi:DNA-binding NarL/FixJ family response regulator
MAESVDVRIVHADPRAMIREAVAAALLGEHHIEVVASTDDPQTTVLQAERTGAEVVVIAGMLNGELRPLCQDIRALDPRPRTLVLDSEGDQETLLRAIEAGADGYLTGASGLAGLADAVHALSRGESVVPPHMLGPLLHRLIRRRRDASDAWSKLDRLTPREREVLSLLVDGLDDGRIAARLVISSETVRTHVKRVLRKLEVHSRVEAIALVAQCGSTDGFERLVERSAP